MRKIKILFSIFLLFVIVSCDKDNTEEPIEDPVPFIDSYSPSIVRVGDTVILKGRNFPDNIMDVTITLNNLQIQPFLIDEKGISFKVPNDIIHRDSKVFDLQLHMIIGVSNIVKMTIEFEPRGWFYVTQDADIFGKPYPTNMHFYGDHDAVVSGKDFFNSTSNGGKSWGGVWFDSRLGFAFDFFDNKNGWVEIGYKDIMNLEFTPGEYTNFLYGYLAKLDTIKTIPKLLNKAITGAFITGPKHGYIMTGEGCIFRIKGSFAPSDISLEYQSTYYKELPMMHMPDFYSISGYDEQNFIASAKVSGATIHDAIPVIIHKKNGVYVEYNLVSQLGPFGVPTAIQMVDPSTAFFCNGNYSIHKLDVTTNSWKKIVTPGRFNHFVFLNKDVGYAITNYHTLDSDRNKVFKTEDGGITWKVVYDFVYGQYPVKLAVKDKKVWVYGTDYNQIFVLKYNPVD